MELSHDWRSFQSTFYPRRKAAPLAAELTSPIYLIIDSKGHGETIVMTFCEQEDLSGWIGSSFSQMTAEYPSRDFVIFEREKVDQWINSSLTLPHFYDQVEHLRSQASGQLFAKGKLSKPEQPPVLSSGVPAVGARHFILEAIHSWWAKLLPSAYGLLIRVEGRADTRHGYEDHFVIVRKGRVDGFHEPDLTMMGPDRHKDPAEVVKYLSEKNLVPVQGVCVSATDWADWQQSPQPWRKIAVALKAKQVKLVPFRWGVVSLTMSRAAIGL